MPDDWIECRLADACDAIDYGLTASASGSEVGPRFLRITDIVGATIDWKSVPFVSADQVTSEKFRLHDGDIVLARTGASTGASSYVKNPPRAIFASYLVRLKAKPEFDPRFLAYYLKSDYFLAFIRGVVGDKSAQPNASASTMTKAPPRAPRDLREQRAIAGVLGALDDKIELNRRMNETLEAMARAIFKSWFVDFGPVRAKAEGRKPFGMDAATAALFPDSFQDSPLGKIPKGWKVGKLCDICTTQYGYTASATEEAGGPKFLRVMDINKRNWIEWASVPYCSADNDAKAKYALAVGDIVVARMADPGKSAIVEDSVDAVFASYLVRLKTKSLAEAYYIYGFLNSELYSEYSEGAMGGSVQANMNARVIVTADLVIPPTEVVQAFSDSVIPLRQSIAASLRQSARLAEIRDAGVGSAGAECPPPPATRAHLPDAGSPSPDIAPLHR